jgi:hypothetical protein
MLMPPISTGPVSHQLAHLPDHSVHQGEYEVERDDKNGENEKHRFIASCTAEMLIEQTINHIMEYH